MLDLPNNNWWIGDQFEFGVCYEFHLYTEPTQLDTCKLARLDIIDPAQPELPFYSVGSTAEHLDRNGFAVEAINPASCESECSEGEIRDLRFIAAGDAQTIEAGGFPWTTLEIGLSSMPKSFQSRT